jgi:hypothetical protein
MSRRSRSRRRDAILDSIYATISQQPLTKADAGAGLAAFYLQAPDYYAAAVIKTDSGAAIRRLRKAQRRRPPRPAPAPQPMTAEQYSAQIQAAMSAGTWAQTLQKDGLLADLRNARHPWHNPPKVSPNGYPRPAA